MYLVVTLLTLTAGAELPVAVRSAPNTVLATAEAAERIFLGRVHGPVSVSVWPLDRAVIVKVGKDVAAVARRIPGQLGAICPEMSAKGDTIEFHCRTRRLDASIANENDNLFLDIFQTRGLPWREGPDGPPRWAYDPAALGLGGACPGNTPASQGECAFESRRWTDAAKYLRQAFDEHDRPFAALRLGDLAMVAQDPTTAIGWYERAGDTGPYGRMAAARLCELSAACFVVRPALDGGSSELPVPLREDLTLRRVRALAFLGQLGKAMAVLAESFDKHPEKAVCSGRGEMLCRRIVLAALRGATGHDSQVAIEVFLQLPDLDKGDGRIDLSKAAAEAATRLGAPAFGAKILSSMAAEVPEASAADHLVRAAELYLLGGDYARARVIFEFVQSRDAKAVTDPRWQEIKKAILTEAPEPAAPSLSSAGKTAKPAPGEDSLAADLQAAASASTRAKTLIEQLQAYGGVAEAGKP